MNKLIALLIIAAFFIITVYSFSNSIKTFALSADPNIVVPTKTPTKTATDSSETKEKVSDLDKQEEKEIEDLKDRIETKVSEKRKENNKAIAGIVEKKDKDSLTIKSSDEEEYNIIIDEALTKYFQINKDNKQEIDFENIEKEDYIIVTGEINDKEVLANFMYIDESYLIDLGNITEINNNDYNIKILTTAKENYTLDIESYTKQLMLNLKSLEFEKMGFSKIKEGDTIHFVVKQSGQKQEDNRYSAVRILIIPQEYFMQ